MSEARLSSYMAGFALSVVLTIAAFSVVAYPAFFGLAGTGEFAAIFTLAVVQLVVQLVFFLHLGSGRGARWNVAMFFLMVGVIMLIIVGSLWIMTHLNYNMTPQQINQYLIDQSG